MVWVNDIVQGILLGGLYALFATGLSLIFGVMRLVNLAHGDLSVLAAYGALLVVVGAPRQPVRDADRRRAAAWSSSATSLQRGLLNHALDEGPMPPLLVTFGLSIIIQNAAARVLLGRLAPSGRRHHRRQGHHAPDQVAIGWFPLLTLVVAVVVLLGLQLFLSRTRMGRAFRATSDNQRRPS